MRRISVFALSLAMLTALSACFDDDTGTSGGDGDTSDDTVQFDGTESDAGDDATGDAGGGDVSEDGGGDDANLDSGEDGGGDLGEDADDAGEDDMSDLGEIVEATCEDGDGDGFGENCAAGPDCDDELIDVNPEADEIYYNDLDDDCDAETGDDDRDGDGHDAEASGGDDCDDDDPEANPGEDEIYYNNKDDDCDDGTIDNDKDGDTFVAVAMGGDDCDDELSSVNPDVIEDENTLCDDGTDHDCAGGDAVCGVPIVDGDNDGWADDDDCAPGDIDVHPGAREIANNGKNDDCNDDTPDICSDDIFDLADTTNDLYNNGPNVRDADLPHPQFGDLVYCASDWDWHTFSLPAASGYQIDVLADDADLGVNLYVWYGSPGAMTDEGEYLASADLASTSGPDGLRTVTGHNFGGAAVDVYFLVYSTDSNSGGYEMTVNIFDDCFDFAEWSSDGNNDFPTLDGYDGVPDAPFTGEICDAGDDDWYRFSLSADESVTIDLWFDSWLGHDLDLEVFRSSNLDVPLEDSTSITDNEQIEMSMGAGTYFIRVFGDGQNDYMLSLNGGHGTATRTLENPRSVPNNGSADVEFDFSVEFGSLISNFDMDFIVGHDNDLREITIEGEWQVDDARVDGRTFWDGDGSNSGGDGGLDDDLADPIRKDVDFNREGRYESGPLPQHGWLFGEDARGSWLFTVTENFDNPGDAEIVELEVTIEYIKPLQYSD